MLGAAPHRAARLGRPGDGAGPAAAAGRRALDRLRAARPRRGARPRLDLRRQLLHARRRGDPAPARSRTGSASCATSRARSSRRSAASWPRRPRRHLRRRLPGRLRRREGGAAPRGRVVRPGRDAARQAAGVRPRRRPTEVPIVTLPGNSVSAYISFEMFVLPAIRTLMGLAPVSRPLLEARLTRGMTSPEGRRQFMRGQVGVDAAGAVRRAGGRSGVAPDRRSWPRPTA